MEPTFLICKQRCDVSVHSDIVFNDFISISHQSKHLRIDLFLCGTRVALCNIIVTIYDSYNVWYENKQSMYEIRCP